MDDFVRFGFRRVGPGGIHCPCCREFSNRFTPNRRRLARYSRRILRHADRVALAGGRNRHL